MQNLSDLLNEICEKNVQMEDIYVLEVRRDLVLNDALKSAQRKGFSVAKNVKVIDNRLIPRSCALMCYYNSYLHT